MSNYGKGRKHYECQLESEQPIADEREIKHCIRVRKVKSCEECLRFTWCKKLRG